MIQCPICQVLNEDAALFCAECGQRFNQAPTSAPPQQPAAQPYQPPLQAPNQPPVQNPHQPPSQLDTLPPDQPPKPSKPKLRSPMLGAVEEEDGYEKPQMSKLRGTSSARQEGSTTGKKHLRSPLLGGDDDDDSYDDDQESSRSSRGKGKKSSESQESTAARKKRLRSPLLGEDDDDDGDNDEDFAPEPGTKKHLHSPLLGDSGPSRGGGKSAKKGSLRSPLLSGDDDFDEDEPPRSSKKSLRSPMLGGDNDPEEHHGAGRHHKGGLHSPLLGDADDYDDDEPSPRRAPMGGATTGGKPKLRSSLLGGGGGYDDDYDDDWDDEDDDNPDVLRSPLLAAKKKKRPKPEAPHAEAAPGPAAHMQAAPPQPAPPAFPGQPSVPFPGPAEPQPPWQNTGAPPIPGAAPQGWPGGAQPQPGQPWPPQGQQPVHNPPLPAGSVPGTPPWQNRMDGGAGPGLDMARAAEVPAIVDDNDEFRLDISAPSLPQANFPPSESLSSPPRTVPPQETSRPDPPKRGRSEDDDEDDLSGPKDRRVRVERRKMPDRRFSSLLDEKGPSGGVPNYDDDYSVGRPQGSAANAGMAKMMLGLGALAMGFKIYQFMEVSKSWDLSKLPMFVAEQFFSGLAIVGLIVLALSCMKK
ncbi:hypothetical protein KF913_20385 [Candidatus Obscuribacterales bacterium]|nr:hypothetical protein [Candidatus Obscuribacterales bacterium]